MSPDVRPPCGPFVAHLRHAARSAGQEGHRDADLQAPGRPGRRGVDDGRQMVRPHAGPTRREPGRGAGRLPSSGASELNVVPGFVRHGELTRPGVLRWTSSRSRTVPGVVLPPASPAPPRGPGGPGGPGVQEAAPSGRSARVGSGAHAPSGHPAQTAAAPGPRRRPGRGRRPDGGGRQATIRRRRPTPCPRGGPAGLGRGGSVVSGPPRRTRRR